MESSRLQPQLNFIIEIDKLKAVLRQTVLTDASRQENSAEHSWHISLMAFVLAEYSADPQVDVFRVMKMLLIHDLVEIDCGDTFCYDEQRIVGKYERESEAAGRIFNLLPSDLSVEIRSLWEEFEDRKTPESKYANALDRLQPMLHNYHTEGHAWRMHGVTADKVIERNRHIADGAPALWDYAKAMIEDAVDKGYLLPAPTQSDAD